MVPTWHTARSPTLVRSSPRPQEAQAPPTGMQGEGAGKAALQGPFWEHPAHPRAMLLGPALLTWHLAAHGPVTVLGPSVWCAPALVWAPRDSCPLLFQN